MKTTHTPRDWRIGKRGGKAGVGAIYGPKGEEIAVFSGMLSPDEELANARLIAAAPELLQALEQFLEMDDGKLLHGPMFNDAVRAAITRATQP